MTNLDSLFNPKSIAIIGISQSPEKIGNVIYKNLKDSGFTGAIYPVNPKYEEIEGLKCYKSVEDIQSEIEVACIVIPKDFVLDTVKACVKKEVKNVIIISAGFGETGIEGKKLEEQLSQLIQNSKTRILGPNCLGIITNSCNISFAKSKSTKGNISFFSQSGALCSAFLDMSTKDSLGFSNFVSMGNKIDIFENDLISYALEDPNTFVISAYIEEIDDDINMLKIYSNSKIKKPFIVFKPGKSKHAKNAMLSHTGSIADNEKVYETAMKQYGIINTESISSMYNLMKGFSWGKEIKGNNIAVITNAGGPGIIATDAILEGQLKISNLSDFTKNKLQNELPEFSNKSNPIDILGDATADRYQKALDIISQDENVDVILVLLTPQYVTQINETTKIIIEYSKQTNKPIIPVFLGRNSYDIVIEEFKNAKIPLYTEVKDAIEVISQMYKYTMYSQNNKGSVLAQTDFNITGKYTEIIKSLSSDEPKPLPDHISIGIINEVGIQLPQQMHCRNVTEAINFAKDRYPVVLKAPNSLIAHKTDLKALFTNIKNDKELSDTFTMLLHDIKGKLNITCDSLLVQKQMKCSEELMLGVKRDGSSSVYKSGGGFGHLLLFGKGGIFTEVYNDFAFSLVPFDHEQLLNMISQTKVAQILAGARGLEPLAVGKLVETIKKLQNLVLMYPEIESLDINPLFIDETEVYAIDVKINLQSKGL